MHSPNDTVFGFAENAITVADAGQAMADGHPVSK
jgi:hypothetical protein